LPIKLSSRILTIVVVAVLILYTAASLAPYLNQKTYWFMSVLGIAFPWLFLIVTVITVWVILHKPKRGLILATLLLLSWKSVLSTFGVHFFAGDHVIQAGLPNLKVLSWNVSRWDQMKTLDQLPGSKRQAMLADILKENADVMCFHEFFEPSGEGLKYYQSNVEAIRAKGYPYYTFFPTSAMHTRTKHFGMAIFSRYPIVDSATYDFANTLHSEGLMFADIRVNEKTFRVYTTHLESFKAGKSGLLANGHKGVISKAKGTILSIKSAYAKRHMQMNFVKDKIRRSPYPILLLGNLGDVPNSETYTVMSDNLNDGFLSFGGGFGATYPGFLSNLRLDYIFVDKKIKLNNFRVSRSLHSDHYPLIADVSLDF
jgi:endonuclease/exonuclease/phosphatase family metal-dependent hydrolase